MDNKKTMTIILGDRLDLEGFMAVVRGGDVRLIPNASNIKAFTEEFASVKA